MTIKNLILLFISLFIFSCTEKVEERIERYDGYYSDGIKSIEKFNSKGTIEKIYYTQRGDTLMLEKPLGNFHYPNIELFKQKVIEKYDNGNKKLMVKYLEVIPIHGNTSDTLKTVIEKIYFCDNGDTLIWEKPFENFYFHQKVKEEILERYDDGEKKVKMKFVGEGDNEFLIEKINYHQNGDTLYLKNYIYNLEIKSQGEYNDRKITSYKDDKKNGKYLRYYRGFISYRGNYLDNMKHGKWIDYNYKDTTIQKIEIYDKDLLMEERYVQNGKIEGTVTKYDYHCIDCDKLISQETEYKDGVKHGESRYFSYLHDVETGRMSQGPLNSLQIWEKGVIKSYSMFRIIEKDGKHVTGPIMTERIYISNDEYEEKRFDKNGKQLN